MTKQKYIERINKLLKRDLSYIQETSIKDFKGRITNEHLTSRFKKEIEGFINFYETNI